MAPADLPQRVPVLIAGGGPVGLTLAALLAVGLQRFRCTCRRLLLLLDAVAQGLVAATVGVAVVLVAALVQVGPDARVRAHASNLGLNRGWRCRTRH